MMIATPRTAAAPLLEHVLSELGHDIISGKLSESETFTLQDLSTRFAISRTVAREVMRALEQLGLVSSSRRVGIMVLPRSSWSVFNTSIINWRLDTENERSAQLRSLNELRVGIEPQAARSSALSATKEQRDMFLELASTLKKLGDSGKGASDEFLETDVLFHNLLLQASGNEMFAALTPSLLSVLHGRTRYGTQPSEPASEALDAHLNLAKAIAAGEANAAEAQSRALLTEVNQALI